MQLQNNAGSLQGYLYSNNAGSFGLLSGDGSWRVRTYAGGQELYGTTTNTGSVVVNDGYVYAYNNVYPIRLGELWGHTGLLNGSSGHVMYFGSDQYFQFLNRSGTYGPGVYAAGGYRGSRWASHRFHLEGARQL